MSTHFDSDLLKLTVFLSITYHFFQTGSGLVFDGKVIKTIFGSADLMSLVDAFKIKSSENTRLK